jgi:sulfur-carrier protein adenylyltransferase/sulfurtransferase
MRSEILSDKELRRYIDQINLPSVGIEGQEKYKQAKVLVIGAGGKGTCILQHLTTAGIGKIGISDNYPVEEKALPRQKLYGNSDLGKQKAIISSQRLKEVNHLVDIELHNVCLSENNISPICNDYDIIVDATDNFPAHYLVNDAAITLNKPLVFGTVFNSLGMVSVFNYQNGPSLRCLYPETPGKEDKPPLKGLFGSSILTDIVGTLMTNEIFKVILGLPTELNGKLLIFDSANYTFKSEKVEKDPKNFKNISE